MKKAKIQDNKLKSYRVWFEQINQTYVDVLASNEECAQKEGIYQWKILNLPPVVSQVAPLDK